MNFNLAPMPSQNQLLRMHWAKRNRLKKSLAWQILAQCADRSTLPVQRAQIVITRMTCGKEPDPDNLTASAKLLLDALRDAGVIVDDSPEHITLDVQWQRSMKRNQQGTRVVVT